MPIELNRIVRNGSGDLSEIRVAARHLLPAADPFDRFLVDTNKILVSGNPRAPTSRSPTNTYKCLVTTNLALASFSILTSII